MSNIKKAILQYIINSPLNGDLQVKNIIVGEVEKQYPEYTREQIIKTLEEYNAGSLSGIKPYNPYKAAADSTKDENTCFVISNQHIEAYTAKNIKEII